MTFLDYAKKLYAVSKFGLAFNKVDKHKHNHLYCPCYGTDANISQGITRHNKVSQGITRHHGIRLFPIISDDRL